MHSKLPLVGIDLLVLTLNRHHDVVKGQVAAWSAREESIIERVREFNKNGVSWTKRVVVMKEDGGPAMSASKSISVPETEKHLIEALTKIFNEQKVRTYVSIVQNFNLPTGLRKFIFKIFLNYIFAFFFSYLTIYWKH